MGDVLDLNLPCAHPGCRRMVNLKQPRDRMKFDDRGRVVEFGVTPLCDDHAGDAGDVADAAKPSTS